MKKLNIFKFYKSGEILSKINTIKKIKYIEDFDLKVYNYYLSIKFYSKSNLL